MSASTTNNAYGLTILNTRDIEQISRSITGLALTSRSMESAAERVCTLLHHSLVDPQTSDRACPLVRIFKTHPFGELTEDLKGYVRRTAPAEKHTPESPCLTLLGTAGIMPSWNSRHLSGSHRAIALTSIEVVERAPMIANLFRQLGCDLDWVVKPNPEVLMVTQPALNVFFIPDARGSEFIPSQSDFVTPYGIRSVIGFGGILPKGDLFVCILFSRSTLSREIALLFNELVQPLRSLLLQYEEQVFFN